MTDSIDISYYAPAFEIQIDGNDLDAQARKSIESITITKKIGQADNFTFKVQDELNNGQFKWLGDDSFKLGNKVSISMGYANNTTMKMQGYIEEVKPQYFTGVMPTFEVAGKDKALALLAEESDYKCYTQKSDSDIVKEIAGEVGLTAEVDDVSGEPPEKKEKKGGVSNLCFIEKMVMQNLGYEFLVSDGKLIFRKSKIQESPIMELEWGKHLFSFEPTRNLSGIITGVTVRWWDQINKEAIIGEAGISDETAVGTGDTAGKVAQEVYGDTKKTITDEPVESAEEAKNIAISVLGDVNKEFVTGKGKTIGSPELTPGVMIEIKGIGDEFSGKYYVSSAAHTIDGSGYLTTFNVRRNTK